MRGLASEYDRRLGESEGWRSGADLHLRLAMLCTLVAWLLAVARFYVALASHEHGVDAVLAALLSAALPGIGAAAAASAFVRRRRRGGADNVVLLRRRDRP